MFVKTDRRMNWYSAIGLYLATGGVIVGLTFAALLLVFEDRPIPEQPFIAVVLTASVGVSIVIWAWVVQRVLRRG